MKKPSRKKRWIYSGKWLSLGFLYGTRCEECGGPLLYISRHDATCCPRCDEWREKACTDPDCGFCAHRPQRPSETEPEQTRSTVKWTRKQIYEKPFRYKQRKQWTKKEDA